MATIIPRKNKDGSTSYRVQIVVKRNGVVVHRESKTFKKQADAKLWAGKREGVLSEPDAIEKIKKAEADITIARLIELYEGRVGQIKSWGRSKQAVLDAWKNRPEGKSKASAVDARWLIDYAIRRKSEGAGPSTVNQDVAFLRSVFSVASGVLGVPVSEMPFVEARATLKKLCLVGKSEERDRRPTVAEMTDIVALAHKSRLSAYGQAHDYMPLDRILVFQMFSGRRISETCRIRWADLDRQNRRVLVRDMKDPGRKAGNDVWVLIPPEAWAVIEVMPQTDERIFPFNPRSVEANFQRTRAKVGHFNTEDDDANLRLHDLRHEALSWLAEKNGLPGENWDIPRIQMVSGHKTWNVLQRYVNLLNAAPVDRWAGWEWKAKVLSR